MFSLYFIVLSSLAVTLAAFSYAFFVIYDYVKGTLVCDSVKLVLFASSIAISVWGFYSLFINFPC